MITDKTRRMTEQPQQREAREIVALKNAHEVELNERRARERCRVAQQSQHEAVRHDAPQRARIFVEIRLHMRVRSIGGGTSDACGALVEGDACTDKVDRHAHIVVGDEGTRDRESSTVDFEARVRGEVVESERAQEWKLPLITCATTRVVSVHACGRLSLLPGLRFPLRPVATQAIPVFTHFVDHARIGRKVVVGGFLMRTVACMH